SEMSRGSGATRLTDRSFTRAPGLALEARGTANDRREAGYRCFPSAPVCHQFFGVASPPSAGASLVAAGVSSVGADSVVLASVSGAAASPAGVADVDAAS